HTNSHVLFLLNGRPVRESVYGGLDIPFLLAFPVETIERVEVVRGPGSVLYGSNAFTGIINVITKAATKSEGQVQAGYGSFETTKLGASGGTNGADFNINGGVNHYKTHGWKFEA